MNHWHSEAMAELNRKEIEREMRHIRGEEQALTTRVQGPGWFTRSMYAFANWMISTGKQIRHRYEVPAADCRSVPTRSFVR
jgi:hypothetical protein